MKKPYPAHIYEPLRKEIAISLAKRELSKLHLDSENLKMPHSERDFWNGFHGIIMGFKLIIGLTQFLTAENINWQKEEIDPKTLEFGGSLSLEKLKNDEPVTDDQPIIVVEKSVHDGNNRLAHALNTNKNLINAYVGKYKTSEKFPKNFWVSTSYLMELVTMGGMFEDFEKTLGTLKKIIEVSDSAKYELKERVLIGDNKFRMKLKNELFR